MTRLHVPSTTVVPEIETIRRAAALMRQRAAAATPGPWRSGAEMVKTGEGDALRFVGEAYGLADKWPNAEHIASWNPVVAVAAADLLDGFADKYLTEQDTPECPACADGHCAGHQPEIYHMVCGWVVSVDCPCIKPVLALAHAYLGGEPA